MKRTQTTTTKEYDENGNLIRETIDVIEEEDEVGTLYPPSIPYTPPSVPQLPWYIQYPTITCTTCTVNAPSDCTSVTYE